MQLVHKMDFPVGSWWWQTHAVRSYGQYCPVAHGAEIFADRWTRSFAAAVAAGEVRLEGRPQVVRAFPTWLRFSHFADDVRAATAAAAG